MSYQTGERLRDIIKSFKMLKVMLEEFENELILEKSMSDELLAEIFDTSKGAIATKRYRLIKR